MANVHLPPRGTKTHPCQVTLNVNAGSRASGPCRRAASMAVVDGCDVGSTMTAGGCHLGLE